MATSADAQNAAEMKLSAQEEAIRIICAKHIHQCFWLPKNDQHEALRITYSTTSNFADTDLPVILVCGPMFGSRYGNVEFDHIARSTGVRVICVDRPGMGGSTRVPLKIRIPTWLEIVPAVLKLLDVKHVSLMCHSAGGIYCFNTLYHLRPILAPERPYVAMIAPWVHYEHSKVALLTHAAKLPTSWIGNWNSMAKFIQLRVAPTLSWSGGLVSAVSGVFKQTEAPPPGNRYGTSDEVGKEIEKLTMKYVFEEDTTAANEDMLLCSKKDDSASWGICDDYVECVKSICDQEKSRRDADSTAAILCVQLFFAESDMMIGKGGQEYLNKCWSQDFVPDVVEVSSQDLEGTDHDTALLDIEKGALRAIFETVARGKQASQN